MNDALVYNWNSVVAPTDTVWALGDVAIGRSGLAHVSRLNGRKLLVAGNHDSCHRMHKRWRRSTQEYMEAGFSVIYNDGWAHGITLPGGLEVNLSHFPYRGGGDHTETERYSEWRLEDEGTTLINGHIHDAWGAKRTGRGTPMVNVGVDQWNYAPVAQETLIELLRDLP
jgi:calcineurin-like phosphoesterase family protein